MLSVIRRIGIAIGSFVIAYLAVSLVAGVLLGQWAVTNSTFVTIVALIVGGLIYVDIMRRERVGSSTDSTPLA